MRGAEGRGGGMCRDGWEKRREVGLERWIGGRIEGIGLIGWVHAASYLSCEDGRSLSILGPLS